MPGGGQPGNQNAAKAKRWEAALERAWAAYPELPDSTDCTPFMRGINLAAFQFVDDVIKKRDIAFYRENADRLDGRSHQSIDASVRGSMTVTLDSADADA